MTELRKHMIEDMQLRGLWARAQEHYARAVRELAEYFRQNLERLTDQHREKALSFLHNDCPVPALSFSAKQRSAGNGPHWNWFAPANNSSCRWS